MTTQSQVKTQTFRFEVRETTVREASVKAETLTEARRILSAWRGKNDLADMGGNAPIQLGDMESVKLAFRVLGSSE
jgi:hypothetical protein